MHKDRMGWQRDPNAAADGVEAMLGEKVQGVLEDAAKQEQTALRLASNAFPVRCVRKRTPACHWCSRPQRVSRSVLTLAHLRHQ